MTFILRLLLSLLALFRRKDSAEQMVMLDDYTWVQAPKDAKKK